MSMWKEMLELEWQQIFSQHPGHGRRGWGSSIPAQSELRVGLMKRTAVRPHSPQAEVIRNLEAARRHHWMKAGLPCPWHIARTNCRWHERQHR